MSNKSYSGSHYHPLWRVLKNSPKFSDNVRFDPELRWGALLQIYSQATTAWVPPARKTDHAMAARRLGPRRLLEQIPIRLHRLDCSSLLI